MNQKKLNLPVLNLLGKKVKEIELPKSIFAAKINLPLMAQAVKVYLSNQRSAFARAKTRSDVSGSSKKIWNQKGTGRARHGDRYAPIFVGGGKAHGPVGNQRYKMSLNKKMRQAALVSCLTAKLNDQKVLVVDGFLKAKPKTKESEKSLAKILGKDFNKSKKHLLIIPDKFENKMLGFRNLPFVDFSLANNLNTYNILNHDYLIFSIESIESLAKKQK